MFDVYFKDSSYYCKLKDVCIKGPQNGLYRKNSEGQIKVNVAKMSQAYGGGCIDHNLIYEQSYITESDEKYLLKTGDLVFGRTSLVPGGAGDSSWVGVLKEPTIFESNLIRFSPDDSIVKSRFLSAWFQSLDGQESIRSINNTVTVSSIKGSDLGRVEVPIPPIELQNQFICFLQQVDKSKFYFLR